MNNILFTSPSPQHAVLKHRMCVELEKKGYTCYHVTASKEAYNWLNGKYNRRVYYLIEERNRYSLGDDVTPALKDIEERYNVSTKRILTGDWNHSQIKRDVAFTYMVQEFMFWEDFITKHNIDLMIGGSERFLQLIPSAVLKSKNKTTLTITASIDADCFRITRDPVFTSLEIKEIMGVGKFTEDELKKADDKLNELVRDKKMNLTVTPHVIKAFGEPKFNLYNLLFFIKRYVKQIIVEKNQNVYGNVPMIASLKIKQAIRKHLSRFYYTDYGSIKNEKYFLFPYPQGIDAQILVRCPQYLHPMDLIEYIARSLPAGYKLIVKEHPLYPGLVPVDNIAKLSKIPNVCVVDLNIDNQELILNSQGVITLNSMSGWEALYHQKPAIIFGDPFYLLTNQAWKVENLFDLPDILRQSQSQPKADRDKLVRFIASLRRLNHKGEYLGYFAAELAVPVSMDNRDKILNYPRNLKRLQNVIDAIDIEINK